MLRRLRDPPERRLRCFLFAMLDNQRTTARRDPLTPKRSATLLAPTAPEQGRGARGPARSVSPQPRSKKQANAV